MKTPHKRPVHEALRQIPYGLYIIGVRGRDNGQMNALAASWVTQCSFDPPLVLVAVRRPSLSYQLIREGKIFTLNLLDKADQELARQLEKPAAMAGDKLGGVPHLEENTGAPILKKAYAYVECEVREIYEPGDHALVVGEVVHGGIRAEGQSLMCSDLGWRYGG